MSPTPIESIPTLVSELRQSFKARRTRPVEWRIGQLRRLAAMLEEREDVFLDALKADLGKCRFEAVLTETAFVLSEIEAAIKHLPSWMKPERVSTPLVQQPGHAMIQRDPLGLALIIAPWNYPVQLLLAPLVGALAAGNCVVLKPSEVAPRTSEAIARWIPEYLDPSCVRVVEGGVAETTALLKEKYDHIFFTGGGTVGRVVMRAAAEHLTPVTLELGGKSPCIVDSDVDLDVAARRIVWGKFINAGQTCIAPDYILACAPIHDALLERMKACVRESFGADPSQSPDYGRIINERHHQRLMKLIDSGDIVTGGQNSEIDRYIAPTILKNVSPDTPVMAEEIFGPILPVIKVQNLEEAIEFVGERPKPLALYLFSSNKGHQRDVLERTTSGGACVNDTLMHISLPELPFGGVGPSGMGAYHGRLSFDIFSHKKSVLNRSTIVDPSLRYPPFTENKMKWAKRLFL